MMRFVNFAAKSRQQLQTEHFSTGQAYELISTALDVHTELNNVFEGSRSVWQYRTAPSTASAKIIDHQHEYPTYLAVILCNGRRDAIVTLFDLIIRAHEICREESEFGLANNQAVSFEIAHQIIRETALEVVASAPQLMDYLWAQLDQPLGVPRDSNLFAAWFEQRLDASGAAFNPFVQLEDNTPRFPYIRLQGDWLGRFTLYPVAMNASVDIEIRECLYEWMVRIAQSTGAQQAYRLASEVKTRIDLDRREEAQSSANQ